MTTRNISFRDTALCCSFSRTKVLLCQFIIRETLSFTIPYKAYPKQRINLESYPKMKPLRTFIVDRSCRQIFFKLFELTILVVSISISRKKNMLSMVSGGGGHFLRGLITKSLVFYIFNSSEDRFFYNLKST